MKENYIESSLNFKDINAEIVEQKILTRFQFLNDKQQIPRFFGSYDFRPEDENMVKFWDQFLKYLFLDIFSTFGMKLSEIKSYTIIQNYIPVGLNNLIQELRIRRKLITDFDITNKEFYIKNFPELYSNDNSTSQGWGSYLLSGVKKFVYFGGSKLGCTENKDENKQNQDKREDISDEDKYITLPDNTIIFNYELLKNNSNEVLSFLSDILQENDNDIISKNEFIKELNTASSNNNGGLYKGINLHFGTIYIDYCLLYLEKIKTISIFTVEENGKKIQFIKLMLNKNDFAKEKDIVISKIMIKCESLQFKLNEFDNKIDFCVNNAKNFLNKGDKRGAKQWIFKKKNYEKYKQIYNNTHTTLINQMMDIKNAESNVKASEILKECNNILKKIGADRDEFMEVSEDIKERKFMQNEINNEFKEFAEENDEELDEEINQLEKENENESNVNGQNLIFPNAVNQPINPFPFETQELYNQK